MAEFYDWAADPEAFGSAEDVDGAGELLAVVVGSAVPEVQVSVEFAELAGLLEIVEGREGWAA